MDGQRIYEATLGQGAYWTVNEHKILFKIDQLVPVPIFEAWRF